MNTHAHDDEDMKIAPSSFSGNTAFIDLGEEAAWQFLEQKECGNIDKARDLGKAYAEAIIHIEKGPLSQNGKTLTQREWHHRLLMYSYIVNRAIAYNSPNSIVAQTCLNVFYTEIEAASQELYKHLSDMAAFSLYVLCERSHRQVENEIGVIYARLCDFDGNRDIIEEGNALYKRVYEYCKDKINEIGYVV